MPLVKRTPSAQRLYDPSKIEKNSIESANTNDGVIDQSKVRP